MAQADIKVIATGQWSETITVREVMAGSAVLVRVTNEGLVVVDSLSADDPGIASLALTAIDQRDPAE